MDKIILGKLLITCIFVIVQFFLFQKRFYVNELAEKNSSVFLSISLLIARIIPFIAIYMVAGFETQSDVPVFFDSAKGALSGGIVYKDFQTVYSPLFPYLIALLLPVWESAKAVVLILILLEGLFVWIFYRLSNSNLKGYKVLLYLFLPSSFMFSVLGGQEDILMWGFLSVALLINQKYPSRILLGVLVGLGLLLTKFIFVLILPAIVFYFKKVKQQFEVIAGILIVGIPTFLYLFSTSQWGFLGPLVEANVPRTPNLWSFFHTVTNGLSPYGPKYLNWLGLATIELFCVYLVLRYRTKWSFESYIQGVFILVYVWLMLIQQSSYANYSFAYLLPLVFYLDWSRKRDVYLFIILSGLLAIQPAIWWRTGLIYINQWSDLTHFLPLTLFIFEGLLIWGMFWLMQKVFQKMES